jgi:predicted MFS family arabinose efflux permease
VGLIGVVTVPAAIALLGTATGSNMNWWALWALVALAVPFAQGSVWTAPVVGRFAAGRGMALAVTLSGPSLASAVMPVIATLAVAQFGWRHGITVFAAGWMLFMLIPVVLFFRGPQDSRGALPAGPPTEKPPVVPGLDLADALRGSALYKLVFVAFAYTFVLIGTVIHLVPMLEGFGATPMRAAATAGLYGIFAIVGRLITGVLLDRFPSNIIGFAGYALPVPGFLLLVLAGVVPANQVIAVSLFGLAAGAQLNIFTYLIARHFGLKRYASLTSLVFGVVAVGSAVGPLVAGASFDRFGSYAIFMISALAMAGLASLAVLSLGRPPFGGPEARGRPGTRDICA